MPLALRTLALVSSRQPSGGAAPVIPPPPQNPRFLSLRATPSRIPHGGGQVRFDWEVADAPDGAVYQISYSTVGNGAYQNVGTNRHAQRSLSADTVVQVRMLNAARDAQLAISQRLTVQVAAEPTDDSLLWGTGNHVIQWGSGATEIRWFSNN